MKTLSIILLLLFAGCSWQGQRHQEFDKQGNMTLNSEWWSMRACWASSGIEANTKTKYYTSGAKVNESMSDPNSIEVVGTTAGRIIAETITEMSR